jgi:hypothetical protein
MEQKSMTFKKELSIDGVLTVVAGLAGIAAIYARLAVVESKVADHSTRLEKVEANTVELKVMVAAGAKATVQRWNDGLKEKSLEPKQQQ